MFLSLAPLAYPNPGVPSLRIVTYNIHHGEGLDGKIDLERIAAILTALKPDVVCLQEVDRGMARTDKRDLPAELGTLLGMQGVFEPNLRQFEGEYGNATFTRLPTVSHENHRLPGPEGAEPRGCLRSTLQLGDVEIDVWNTHLGLNADERARQGRAIAGLLHERPSVVCGDLNEDINGEGGSALSKPLAVATPKELAAVPSYPSNRPAVRIDHILASAEWKSSGGALLHNAQTAVASDHLPLWAELTLEGPAPGR